MRNRKGNNSRGMNEIDNKRQKNIELNNKDLNLN